MKHKRTKATEISLKVKKIVWLRDCECCIHCQRYVPMFYANSHYIKRSQGGLGIPQNIVTACDICHREEEQGKNSKEYKERERQYLSDYYGEEWKEENLVYRKDDYNNE